MRTLNRLLMAKGSEGPRTTSQQTSHLTSRYTARAFLTSRSTSHGTSQFTNKPRTTSGTTTHSTWYWTQWAAFDNNYLYDNDPWTSSVYTNRNTIRSTSWSTTYGDITSWNTSYSTAWYTSSGHYTSVSTSYTTEWLTE